MIALLKKSGLFIALALFVLLIAMSLRWLLYEESKPKNTEAPKNSLIDEAHIEHHHSSAEQGGAHSHIDLSKPGVTTDSSANAAKQPRHIDMLSEEMKQSIRDQLFQHGPKTVIQLPNGSYIMPHEGRVTQMPVAVEMPDGTIQIKEYSELPE